MSTTLIIATTAISLALVFYTIGVWSERKTKTLKKWHVITFWIGLMFDTAGTLIMSGIAKLDETNTSAMSATIHGITGGIAIALMIFHAIWATIVIAQNDNRKKQIFHRFSVVVWAIWLIPYFIGMVIGMTQ